MLQLRSDSERPLQYIFRSPITPTPATIAKGRASRTDPTGYIGEEQTELSVLTGMADRTDLTMGGFGFEMTESSGSESELGVESTPLGERRIMMTSRGTCASFFLAHSIISSPHAHLPECRLTRVRWSRKGCQD